MLLVKLEHWIDALSELLGKVAAILFVLLLCNVFYDVIARYLFNDVSIGMQELEWHLYATIFLLGVPFALKTGGHVRVDLFYERLSPKQRAVIDLGGVLIFLLPFTLLVAWYGIGFAYEAYELGERSGDPGGLPYRWIIKSMIPLSFTFMALSGLGMALHAINTLRGVEKAEPYKASHLD